MVKILNTGSHIIPLLGYSLGMGIGIAASTGLLRLLSLFSGKESEIPARDTINVVFKRSHSVRIVRLL